MADIYVFTEDEITFKEPDGGGEVIAIHNDTDEAPTKDESHEQGTNCETTTKNPSSEDQLLNQTIEELMAHFEKDDTPALTMNFTSRNSQEDSGPSNTEPFGENAEQGVEDEEEEEVDLTSLLNPFEKVLRYSQSTDFFDRQLVCRTLHEALRFVLESPEFVNTVLEVMVNFSNINDYNIRTELMEQVPQIAFLCHDFPDKLCYVVTSTLVPMVVRALTDKNEQVRKTSQAALLVLLEQELISHADVHDQVCPVILDLTEPDAKDDFKTEAVALMSKMAPLVGVEMTERLFIERFTTLCSDNLFQVRKVCAANFGEFSGVIGREITENTLLPLFVVLCEDGVWGIRKACADVFMTFSCACSLDIRRKHLSPIFISLLTDQSRWVRVAAFQNLGPFISTFADPSFTGLKYIDGVLLVEELYQQKLELGTSTSENKNAAIQGSETESTGDVSNNCDVISVNKHFEEEESPPDIQRPPPGIENENPSFNEVNYWKIPLPDIPLETLIEQVETVPESVQEAKIPTLIVEDADVTPGDAEVPITVSHQDDPQEEEEEEKCNDAQTAPETASVQPEPITVVEPKEEGNDCPKEIHEFAATNDGSDEAASRRDNEERQQEEEDLFNDSLEEDLLMPVEGGSSSSVAPPPPSSDSVECLAQICSSLNNLQSGGCEQLDDQVPHHHHHHHRSPFQDDDIEDEDFVISSLTSTSPRNTINRWRIDAPPGREGEEGEGEPPYSWFRESFNDNLSNAQIDTSILNNINQDIVPKTLLEHYISMTDPSRAENVENEVARHCAFSLPAVALTLGRKFWPMLKNTYKILAGHMHWKVRRTLAFSIHELALILGDELTKVDLLPVFEDLIKDLDEVRIGIVKHLSDFLKILPEESRRSFLPRLKEFLKADNGLNWRFRQELALQLAPLSELFSPQECWDFIVPVTLLVMANEKIVCIRKTCYSVISKLAHHMLAKDSDALILFLSIRLIQTFANANTWTKRQSYVYAVGQIIKDSAIPLTLWCELFLKSFLKLAIDRVPNIRAAVAKITNCYLVEYAHLMDSQDAALVEEAIEKLRDDYDSDVRYYSSNQYSYSISLEVQDTSLY